MKTLDVTEKFVRANEINEIGFEVGIRVEILYDGLTYSIRLNELNFNFYATSENVNIYLLGVHTTLKSIN